MKLARKRVNPARLPARLESVQRAVKAMEIMAGLPDGVSVLEISEKLGVTKGMVSRILASLEDEGYVQQDPYSRRYFLTFKVVALANRHATSASFPELCQSVLRRLVQASGERAQLVLVGPGGRILYAQEDSMHEVQVVHRLGRVQPLHCSASEKVYLASLPEEEALARLAAAGLPRLTPNTITSLEAFRVDLRKVRAQGYATNEGERALDVNTVAVPMYDREGRVVAALGLAGPSSRFTSEKLPSFVPMLKEAAGELSQAWPFPDLDRTREVADGL
ncbi:MAG: IclR family transcriptional regulator [Bacteroidetes bacterium]|nr:IclR family transcriptional regulator [Bacteroidota bacterium]MCL5026298.1 IclR family transcriptional regulator [Chloroflexota bacterium]